MTLAETHTRPLQRVEIDEDVGVDVVGANVMDVTDVVEVDDDIEDEE